MKKILFLIFCFISLLSFSQVCEVEVEHKGLVYESINAGPIGYNTQFEYENIQFNYTSKLNQYTNLYTNLHLSNVPEFSDTIKIKDFFVHEDATTITIKCVDYNVVEHNQHFKVLSGEYGSAYNEKFVMQYFDWVKVIDMSQSILEKITNTHFYSNNEKYSLEKVYFPKTLRSIEGEFCRFHIDSIFCYDISYLIRITESTFIYDKSTIVVVNDENIYNQMLNDENWSKFTIVLKDTNQNNINTSIKNIEFYNEIQGLYFQDGKIMYKGKKLRL